MVEPQPAPPPQAKPKPKPKKRKRHLAATRHVKRIAKPEKATPKRQPADESVRVAAPASASSDDSGSGAILILVGLLIALSLLAVVTAVVPPSVLPPRVGALVAQRRADLATAGVTGAVCLLFAFLIAWMS